MLTSINIYLLITSIILIPGYGIRIKSLELPTLLQTGSHPVKFICVYELLNTDSGIVIKWYHNEKQIYEWIPPLAPRDMGIMNGLIEYPWENINRPHSHSILEIKNITTNLSGVYTCKISTFQDEDSKSANVTVYVPVNKVMIKTAIYNETHLNISCETFGAHPSPKLKILINGLELEGETNYASNYHENPWTSHHLLMSNPKNSSLFECEIEIPEVN
ncbi:uncharacterized protein LOC127290395 [Leptopilina boulardi]|uniref:uncharacterized protein LOC127290395 n=1 Tax=Leptopilina boulardi TaxID=63433 RepID=UPI0021F60DB4|nr:uncharacterized protein LOC127290395 [Leptopilina boulardi]